MGYQQRMVYQLDRSYLGNISLIRLIGKFECCDIAVETTICRSVMEQIRNVDFHMN